ncbi:MAG: ribosomal-processing cysteine protease Prp [Clostridia bacterium]|nr:ribosomal-processing cysteine protease Prp [Clostridia bacterium]
MIEAFYDNDALTLTLCGHAEYAPKGKDIVCAGVSTLVYTLINGCRCEITGETVRVKDDRRVYDAVLTGLKMISEKFPKNLRVVPYRTDVLL